MSRVSASGLAKALLAPFFALLVAAAPPYAPAAEGERVAYRNVVLIDGGRSRPGMAVLTNGPTIEAVVTDSSLTAAQLGTARVVDLGGRFMLPGLIDSHQHLATPPDRRGALTQMHRDLFSGITAVRIMADDLRAIAELARESLVGEVAGPDLHFAALVAGRSFFDDPRTRAISAGYTPGETPWAQAITAETDLALAVARARGTGASALKIYANLSPDLIRRLTQEAHRQGMPVWAHGMVFPTPPAAVIAAGPDAISHICYLAYQLSTPPPASYQQRFPVNEAALAGRDNPVMAGLFREMRRRGIILDATLRVYREAERRAASPGGQPTHCSLDLAARLTDQARRAGVRIAAGTDGTTPRESVYPALFDEIELLVTRAGFSTAEALVASTETGAATIGQSAQMGRIQSGYLANLLVLEADPLADIRNLRRIAFAVKRGRRFDRSDYVLAINEMPVR